MNLIFRYVLTYIIYYFLFLETTVIPQSFNAGINELFENVERKFGHILVSHAVR